MYWQDCLEDRERAHMRQVTALRHERPPLCHAHARGHHEARNHEARACEREDGRHVGGVNPKQLVADLHARNAEPHRKHDARHASTTPGVVAMNGLGWKSLTTETTSTFYELRRRSQAF